MSKRVAILESIFGNDDIERAALEPRGYEVSYHSAHTEEEIIAAGKGACGLLLETVHITGRILDALPEVRVVSRYGVGYDTIDVPAATARNVAVMNVPDYCMDEVAEHAIALMFSLSRGIVAHDRMVRQGGWITERYGVRTLAGRKIGIIGYGRIGHAVAWRAAGLGMDVLVYDPAPLPLAGVRAVFMQTLPELLAQADVVTLHVPLSERTRGLMGAAEFAVMKRDAILVNTARGPVVDTAALIDALHKGLISGAAADVQSTEPLPPQSPLLSAPNLILTPHIAWYSPESQLRMRRMVAENVADFYDGKGDAHIVNKVKR
ncbi:MAG: C-terminal binding protein [Chloroflexi bacterium]|nr:C-terminal binding protein [Chloroflexota bacterium]MCL5276132.1 C-terminal binding protein [Chloroflexota bacterium]